MYSQNQKNSTNLKDGWRFNSDTDDVGRTIFGTPTSSLKELTGEDKLWNAIAIYYYRDPNTMSLRTFRTLVKRYCKQIGIRYNKSRRGNLRILNFKVTLYYNSIKYNNIDSKPTESLRNDRYDSNNDTNNLPVPSTYHVSSGDAVLPTREYVESIRELRGRRPTHNYKYSYSVNVEATDR